MGKGKVKSRLWVLTFNPMALLRAVSLTTFALMWAFVMGPSVMHELAMRKVAAYRTVSTRDPRNMAKPVMTTITSLAQSLQQLL